MKRTFTPIVAAILLVLSFAAPVAAGKLEDAIDAAEQGTAAAQYDLGSMYYWGWFGVPQDFAEGAKWWRKAADQGFSPAQFWLAHMYALGYGVPQDYAEAMKWYRLAADQGLGDAQDELAYMYVNGHGVPKDYVLAYMWLNLAAPQGISGAAKERDDLAQHMTPEQIAEAQKLASEWKPTAQPTAQPTGRAAAPSSSSATEIQLVQEGGVFKVPVVINGSLLLKFMVDSGAADVSIPADVVMTLMRTGTLQASDFLGSKTYVLADGSNVPSQTFIIRALKVGDRVIENVPASMSNVQGSLLLGQSFLSRFRSWSIDNQRQVLVLE